MIKSVGKINLDPDAENIPLHTRTRTFNLFAQLSSSPKVRIMYNWDRVWREDQHEIVLVSLKAHAPSLNNFSVCVPFYGSAFECHWPGSGGDGWNYWSERNKAVTFIALSDLLRHQGNKQKAKLIVPDHIRPVTPPPDPTGTTALFCFQHALLPFSAAPDILTKKQTAWRPRAGLELQMWQSDLWDDQSSDFLLRDSDWGANGPVG